MSIYADIAALIAYAEERELISPLDRTYMRNRLCDILALSEFREEEPSEKGLEEILVSLPIRMRVSPSPEASTLATARPILSASSGVKSLLAIPRTPSVPKSLIIKSPLKNSIFL